jgi:CheY-like chemotaxis protein/HPt (histidine-containing phosphotransfer) domain-containing protein
MILLVPLVMQGDMQSFKDIGFSACLTKPVRQDRLKEALGMTVDANDALARPVRHNDRHSFSNQFADRKARILVAEDNSTNQQVVVGIMRNLGLCADVVANGLEAVKAIESIAYDLVLMDVQMPEMDGFEATRAIRNLPLNFSRKRVTVIAMTAHALQGDRERCINAGMDDYVTKPISPQTLVEVFKKCLPAAQHEAPEASQKAVETSSTGIDHVFDREGVFSRLMGDTDLIKTVIRGYIEDIPRQIKKMREKLKVADAVAVSHVAHYIKGASANVGGESLRKVAFEIEKLAKTGDLTATAALMDSLEAEFGRLKEALRNLQLIN